MYPVGKFPSEEIDRLVVSTTMADTATIDTTMADASTINSPPNISWNTYVSIMHRLMV